MDDERDIGQARGPDMRAERGLLHVPWRAIIEVIQPQLANSNHLGVVRQSSEFLRFGHRLLCRVVRMDADRAPEVLLRSDYRRQALRLRQRGPDGDHLTHAGRRGARQHARPFSLGVVVQVAMRIDQHQGIMQQLRRNVGTLLAVPATHSLPAMVSQGRRLDAPPRALRADPACVPCCPA